LAIHTIRCIPAIQERLPIDAEEFVTNAWLYAVFSLPLLGIWKKKKLALLPFGGCLVSVLKEIECK
jgi:hypothetical protein